MLITDINMKYTCIQQIEAGQILVPTLGRRVGRANRLEAQSAGRRLLNRSCFAQDCALNYIPVGWFLGWRGLFIALMMEAVSTSETSAIIYQNTRRSFSERSPLLNRKHFYNLLVF
jgi:hypothetical protein